MKLYKSTFVAGLFCALVFGQFAMAAPPTPSAGTVISSAETKAASEGKNVLVIFHASWCGWCHKLDDFLAKPEIAPLIDANYVTVHIVVQENGDKKDLDNPGGDALLESLGGKDQGIPYYAILSPKNETLAVSKDDKGNNLGYPGEDTEIPVFMKMIRTTSAQLSDPNASLIESKLREDGKKIHEEQEAQVKLIKPIQDAMAKQDYKVALTACDEVIASHPDQAGYAQYMRYQALLHVDEGKALSEIGHPMGTTGRKEADTLRASMIVEQDSLSDGAYKKALNILLSGEKKAPATWSEHMQIAHAYARVHKMKEAVEYQDKAIEEAKAAKLPQRLVDMLSKSKAEWQSKS